MLFITNRILNQSPNSRANRAVTFDLSNNNVGQSVYFCRRNSEGDYTEILSDPFFSEIRQSTALQILFFIHGFDNLPERSIFQRAETLQGLLDMDPEAKTMVIPIIWPCKNPDESKNTVGNYLTDENAADLSGFSFGRVFAKFQEFQENSDPADPCQKRINVLAHSMGNRVFRQSLVAWSEEIRHSEPPLLFRNTFLMAADVVNETLQPEQKGSYIPMASKNVMVYFNGDDLALRASKVVNARDASRRLGHTGPYDFHKVPGNVWGIDCERVANQYDRSFGHTYFLESNQGGPGLIFSHILRSIKLGRPVSGPIGLNRQFDIENI